MVISCQQPASPIDVDNISDSPSHIEVSEPTISQAKSIKPSCHGIIVELPLGTSAHSGYPFGLHDELGDPWDYAVTAGVLVLRACQCSWTARKESQCHECAALTGNPNLQGVLARMKSGVHENTRLHYHNFGSLVKIIRVKTKQNDILRFRKLNDARKITRQAVSLDDHKQWIMAIASGKVENVGRLVKTALENGRGIRHLLDISYQAAAHIYHPKNYTEEDYL